MGQKGVSVSIERRLAAVLKSCIYVLGSLNLEGDERKVRDLLEGLQDKFLILVLGEFNSGKSTFVNAFLGEKLLATSILPETAAISVVRYGSERKVEIIYKDLSRYEISGETEMELIKKGVGEIDRVEFWYPLRRLETFFLVDTPGLNSIFRDHEQTTGEFLHRADMIVWIFDALKVGKLREKSYLEHTRGYAAKMIGVVNKIDLVDDKEICLLDQLLVSHFKGFFSKIFYMSSLKGCESGKNVGRENDYREKYGLRQFEEFLFEQVIPARKCLKSKATLSGLNQVLGQTFVSLDNGERDLIEKENIIQEITERLEEIKKFVTGRCYGLISETMKVFVENSKKACTSFLVNEISMSEAFCHWYKRLGMAERFERNVIGDELVKSLLMTLARNIEDIVAMGWRGRIEANDTRNCVHIWTSSPVLGNEIEAVANGLYHRVAEITWPLLYLGIVISLILLALPIHTMAALLPMSAIVFGVTLGRQYMVIKRKRLVKESLRSIDEYCRNMSEKAREAVININEKVFCQAQDKAICDILGYKLSYGEVKERLVSIRKGREELKKRLNEAKELEKDLMSGLGATLPEAG